MVDQIRKIDSIKNMAVFKDFEWKSSIRVKGNNVGEFKEINIFYGRNYSGKTTLSRIFRALEIGSISNKYNSPEFQLSFRNGSTATQDSLASHGQVVRVFNEDFVRDNLRFIVDDEHAINSFAILGEDNAKLEKEIEQCEAELGSEEDRSGLLGKLIDAEEKLTKAKESHVTASTGLDNKLRDKATRQGNAIKKNKLFGDPNYDIRNIKEDINIVTQKAFSPIDEKEEENLKKLLKDESKRNIPECSEFALQYSTIVKKSKELIEKDIKLSEPIQELLEDAVLNEWVRTGREHHQGERDTCAFCGSRLPQDLWDKLDKHFNQESETLRNELKSLEELIDSEMMRIRNLLTINQADFYSKFTDEVNELSEQLSNSSENYTKSLTSIKTQVQKRKENIFQSVQFDTPESFEEALNGVRVKYEELRSQSNQLTKSLEKEQSTAKNTLRLNAVYKFAKDIEYKQLKKEIASLEQLEKKKESWCNEVQKQVDTQREAIDNLKKELKNESNGANRVNDYLNDFFGHRFLSLSAIEEPTGDASSGYRFEVTRNGEKAFHLSEGECSLIAFCYFMAKLEDIETKGNQPIIWIDDPISSLDANHIFFVYSLINAKIVQPKQFTQLFISTHNLDFLKYLKRLPGANNKNTSQYFIINRTHQVSDINPMPEYLKRYITEFNFLFHQIYRCAEADTDPDESHDCYYNFGNNARKFLEVFLYYRYPNAVAKDQKLARFFGDDELAVTLTERINNEFSHLEGLFEQGATPIDIPEMNNMANFILKKIEEKDPDQYEALLESIGVTKQPAKESETMVLHTQ